MTHRSKTVIEMAREAWLDVYGLGHDREAFTQSLERFAALVREDEREKQQDHSEQDLNMVQEPVAWVKAKELAIAKSLSDDGYAKQWSTTLGFKKEDGDIPLYTTTPTIEAAVLAEREACAKVCEELGTEPIDWKPSQLGIRPEHAKCAETIRARKES